MRIAFITTMPVYPWGGSEELWAMTAERAAAEGHQVLACVFRWSSRAPNLAHLESRGVKVIERRRGQTGRFDVLINKFYDPFKAVAEFKPDVICVSQGGTYDVAVNSESVRFSSLFDKLKAPFILICQALSSLEIPLPEKRAAVVKIFAQASAVAFVAQSMLEMAQRHLCSDIHTGIVVRNPVNLGEKTEVPWPSFSQVNMAIVARLEPRKGLDLLLDVLRRPAWLSRNWKLRVCGDGPHRSYYQELAKYFGIADRVEFLGHVNDVRSIWADNNLLVLPTHAEGTPLAMVEAMLCGRVTVATDVGGIREWITEGKTGFLAEAPTVDSFANALERAWMQKGDWENIAKQARQTAIAQADPDAPGTILKLLNKKHTNDKT